MKKRIHMSQSVSGAIRNWTKAEWKRNAKSITIDGKHLNGEATRDAFIEMLASGIRYIPIGECDNFDPQSGCLGHELPDDDAGEMK